MLNHHAGIQWVQLLTLIVKLCSEMQLDIMGGGGGQLHLWLGQEKLYWGLIT
jgi:hypothetical protein